MCLAVYCSSTAKRIAAKIAANEMVPVRNAELQLTLIEPAEVGDSGKQPETIEAPPVAKVFWMEHTASVYIAIVVIALLPEEAQAAVA